MLLQIKAVLADKAAKGLDASITYYSKQPHGYSLRAATDPLAAPSASAAFVAGANFFKKNLN